MYSMLHFHRKFSSGVTVEWKEQVLEKLEKVDKLVVQVQRVTDVLEKLAGIESQDSDEGQISWLESEGEETEVQESIEKRK